MRAILLLTICVVSQTQSLELSGNKTDKNISSYKLPKENQKYLEAFYNKQAEFDLSKKLSFPSIITSGRQIPLITSGSCTAGVPYTIQNLSDLYNFLDQLECIFNAGHEPTEIGLGYYYAVLLLAANSASLDVFAKAAYQGDYVIKTHCHNRPLNIGVLNLGGVDVGTAEWYVGHFPGDVTRGEYLDDRKVLIMDFRVEMKTLCPPEGNRGHIANEAFLPFRSSLPPAKNFVDICRVVGRDSKDGGLIYLCRGYSYTKDYGFCTLLFYAVKNLDSRVEIVDYGGNVRFFAENMGEEILVQTSFSYSRRGLGAAVLGVPATLDSLKHINDIESKKDVIKYEEFVHKLVNESSEAKGANIELINTLLEKGKIKERN